MMSVGLECEPQDSSFHGTAIAGIIAANSNDTLGITGIDWHAQILPVRISGKCGGARSDMIDAIRWAAGVEDPKLPPNPNPARVINLSLGAENTCGFAEQEAINDAWNAGAVVVAAVGNSAKNMESTPIAPANCDHVIAVTAVRQDGARSYYSNYGTDADIAAPGGEDVHDDYGTPMIVASNHGTQAPIDGSHFKHVAGTSAAAAHVSGVISLMIGARPSLTPSQIEYLLLSASRPFPDTEVLPCDQTTCGEGLLDAYLAVTGAINADLILTDINIAAAKSDAPNENAEKITTGTGGGAGGCSLNKSAAVDPLFYLTLLALGYLNFKRKKTA
jgi:serine protease